MAARVLSLPPFDLVIFGGTGDLARRKLLPALYHLMKVGQIPEDARIIAAARSEIGTDGYRAIAREALETFLSQGELDGEVLERFLGCVDYQQVDAHSNDCWPDLAAALERREGAVRAFYLAVAPEFFGPICERLNECGAATPDARLVVEKPIGHDLESAVALNTQLSAAFEEHCLYRIDHYLGKETVQNLMALRFANALFEPLWNGRHVDHVQITVAEALGVEGRGAYYDRAGAMRDMVQNHLLQLLCLTAMEPPAQFDPNAVRDEKLKVLKALEPIDATNVRDRVVSGQYRGYLDEPGIDGSTTETFVALNVAIVNWRWSGTPFYLRTGKNLRAGLSEIVVVFKDAPHSIFPKRANRLRGNALIIRLQPDEGITLRLTIKDPSQRGMRLIEVPLDMTFAETLGDSGLRMPGAYERLVMDVILGDQTLFMRGDEVEAAWAWVDPILDAWKAEGLAPSSYDAGGSGPEDALMLLHRDGRRWREIEA